jgi:hypothetical protein
LNELPEVEDFPDERELLPELLELEPEEELRLELL